MRLRVEPLPTWVWYQDMLDFTEKASDDQARQRLGRALDGRDAFSRFRNELHEEYPSSSPRGRSSGTSLRLKARRHRRIQR